jgi:YihY family inner membrane protein
VSGRLRALARALAEDDLAVYAASIAYAGILSVFPLLVGVIVLLSLMVDQHRAQEAAVRALQPYLPSPALDVVRDTIASVIRTRSAAGALAAAGLLWTSTAVAGALRHALNRILRAGRPRAFWRRKMVELAAVALGGGFLGLSVLVPAARAALRALPGVGPAVDAAVGSPLLRAAAWVAPWLFAAAAFCAVYRFLPNVTVGRWSLLAGTDDLDDFIPHRVEADSQRFERFGGDALSLVEEAKEDVLGADVVVVEQPRLFLGQHYDPAGSIRESLKQGSLPGRGRNHIVPGRGDSQGFPSRIGRPAGFR